jgi:glycosyltransferase involved in cell wall biosynthesis
VIHKHNGGLSDARNVGIRASKGDYLAFVDGDDYIAKGFVKALLGNAIKNDADISVCSLYKVYADQSKSREVKRQRIAVLNNVQAMQDILLPSSLCGVMTWNKLYKRSLFLSNRVEFPVGKIHEDVFTTYKLFFFANKVVFVDKPLYFYIQRGSSIQGSGFSGKNLVKLEACEDIARWIEDKKLPLKEEVAYYRIVSTLDLIDKMSSEASDTYKKDWEELTKWILSHRKEALFHNKHVTLVQKAMVCSVLLGRRPYVFLRWFFIHTIRRQPMSIKFASGQ